MSTFSFSHQFSQHWLNTLPAIKTAIIDELSDIATLLQPETNLSSYAFSVPKLDSHIEHIIAEEKTRLATLQAQQQEQARLENERLAQEQRAQEQAENERLEQIRREEIRLEQERLEQIRVEKERLEQQRLLRENQERAEAQRIENEREEFVRTEQQANALQTESNSPLQVEEPKSQPLSTHLQPNQKTTAHFANMATMTSVQQYGKLKQEITANLIQQMEDYIQESIQIMRDDLRPWLESEVEKQLNERLNQGDNPF